MLSELKKRWNNSSALNRFLIKGGVLYAIWRIYRKASIVYDFNGEFTNRLADFFLFIGKYFLLALGYPTHVDYVNNTLELSPDSRVLVVYTCMAVNVIALFAFFIVAYPGRIKNKLWFITAGIFVIMLVNSIRMALLSLVLEVIPDKFDLFHDFILQGVLYVIVFAMWYIWIKYFSNSFVNKTMPKTL